MRRADGCSRISLRRRGGLRYAGSMKRILLSVACIVLSAVAWAQPAFVTLDPEPKLDAWWLRARFNPTHAEIRGIPVAQIRRDWCKASEITREAIPPELLVEDGTDLLKLTGFTFSVEGNFDRSATPQVALVGVYETCRGERGAFLLIIDKDSKRVRFLDTRKTEHQFAALLRDGDTIHVTYCLECDVGAKLRWSRSKKAFAWTRR
jgi:hypothetical protein